jgi:hypothetical protein
MRQVAFQHAKGHALFWEQQALQLEATRKTALRKITGVMLSAWL